MMALRLLLSLRSPMLLAPAAALAGACSQPDSAASRTGGGEANHAAAGFYAATARSAEFPTPDTGSFGRFLVERGCLVFVAEDGARYLPVFPLGTRFGAEPGPAPVTLPTDAGVGGSLRLDRPYTVKGGASEYRLDPLPPEACPDRQFLVGGLL